MDAYPEDAVSLCVCDAVSLCRSSEVEKDLKSGTAMCGCSSSSNYKRQKIKKIHVRKYLAKYFFSVH